MSDDIRTQIEELKQNVAILRAKMKLTLEKSEMLLRESVKHRREQKKEQIQYKNKLLNQKIVLICISFTAILRYEKIKRNNPDNYPLQRYCQALQCFCLIQAYLKMKEIRWINRTKSTELSYQLLLKGLKQL